MYQKTSRRGAIGVRENWHARGIVMKMSADEHAAGECFDPTIACVSFNSIHVPMKKDSNAILGILIFFGLLCGVAIGVGTKLFPIPLEPIACEIADAECKSSVASTATATIAWWTRIDTIFSLFTGVAAYFAYKAYKAAEKDSQISQDRLDLEKLHSEREKEQFADRERGKVTIREFAVTVVENKEGNKTSSVVNLCIKVRNTGRSTALDVGVAGLFKATIHGEKEAPEVHSRNASWETPRDLEPGEETTLTLRFPLICSLDEILKIHSNIAIDFHFNIEWFDTELNRLNFSVWESDSIPARGGEYRIPIMLGEVALLKRDEVIRSVRLPVQRARLPTSLNPNAPDPQ